MIYRRFLLIEKFSPKRSEHGIMVADIIRERIYHKWGYVIRDETWIDPGNCRTDMHKMAYNFEGDWIGDSKLAYRLANRYGVTHTEKIGPNSSVCSIGFSERENKWYGWSHRALFGFGVGSECKKGNSHYYSDGREAFKEACLGFWADESSHALDDKRAEFGTQDGVKGVFVRYTYDDKVPNERLRGTQHENFSPFPEKWGRGEWTAKSLRDAKQMAIDFSRSVS